MQTALVDPTAVTKDDLIVEDISNPSLTPQKQPIADKGGNDGASNAGGKPDNAGDSDSSSKTQARRLFEINKIFDK